MKEEEATSFVVLSDTHLGLRAWKRFHFFENTVSHRPTHVDQFLNWLGELQTKCEIDVDIVTKEPPDEGEYEISSKKLSFPDKLVLNGDIFELWDASDESIQFASHSILNSISRLKCQKLYLIGNHDFSNARFAEKIEKGKKDISDKDKKDTYEDISDLYPWGLSNIRFISDTHLLRVGDDRYLLLHGHQFEKYFRIGHWKILSYIRDGAEAFRLYSWFLVLLFGVSIPWYILTAYPENTWFQHEKLLPIILLGVLAFPRISLSLARPIWNHFFGSRYKRDKALEGFEPWWKKFRSKLPQTRKKIQIIYGHTHAIDLVEKRKLEEIVKKPIEGQDLILINHPSWTKDTNDKYDTQIRTAFVYVDKDGFEFFGWNWTDNKPFHIPKFIVRHYRDFNKLPINRKNSLLKLNWPEKLIDELTASNSKSKLGT